jgi:DNA-binding CsgD family transcriptional regulator
MSGYWWAMKRDYVAIIEAAYVARSGHEEWTKGIAEAAQSCLDAGLGVIAYTYDITDLAAPRFQHVSTVGAVPEPVHSLFADGAMVGLAGPDDDVPGTVWRGYAACPPVLLLSEAIGQAAPGLWAFLAQVGIGDVIGIRAGDPNGRGCFLSAASPTRQPIAPRTRHMLNRIAAHIAAGWRLRTRYCDPSGATPGTDSAELILDPEGKLLHGEPESRSQAATLDAAIRARAKSRGSLRSESPPEAVALWRGLVQGRWSIVDHTDHDGRRFLLARRNEPHVSDPAALAERERQVAAYAALGHSVKFIAYELGLSSSTVSEHLKSALRKLGIRTRQELAALFGPRSRSSGQGFG